MFQEGVSPSLHKDDQDLSIAVFIMTNTPLILSKEPWTDVPGSCSFLDVEVDALEISIE